MDQSAVCDSGVLPHSTEAPGLSRCLLLMDDHALPHISSQQRVVCEHPCPSILGTSVCIATGMTAQNGVAEAMVAF